MGKKIFKSKKDQSDFFIALAVIALFLWLFYGKVFKKNTVFNTKQNSELLVAIQDADKDGIADSEDECPNRYGSLPNGCPTKSKETTKEKEEKSIYPSESKSQINNLNKKAKTIVDTMPTMIVSPPQIIENTPKPDSDKDGIADDDDKCPFTKGVKENFGCPADRDNDGVIDSADRCPDVAGVEANDGCPELKLEEADQKIIQEAIQNVQFETASARLKQSSLEVLNKVALLLQKYPKARLKIDGHTDSEGDDNKNLELSKARATACKNYLVQNKEINSNRILANGYGETQPKATNDTAEGRRQNRRVEFHLNY